MATIKDIAERLGVSVSTVSKGLNGASDISEELRQTVLDTAVELGYTTKRMRKEEHKKLCIFIENMEFETANQFGYEIILGFKQAAYRDKWDVSVIPITHAFQNGEKYDTYMLKNGFSGAFLLGFSLEDEWMNQLSTTNIPTSLLDNYIRINPSVGSIATDSFEGIDIAVEHLVALGHTKIAFLNGSPGSTVTAEREQAFKASILSHGLAINPDLLAQGHYVADSAKYHVPKLLEAGATAIVCGNDLIASGVITECRKQGLSVPEDISVIGFDDLPISVHLTPPLTTVKQDRIELGKSGYYTLVSLMNKVSISKTILRAQFINRESTGICKERRS